ncbi:MAG: aspartate-alanine antiporter [Alphaproteobacteria bacterium]|nr:aspartate-alanine antiporter [Alphaproteobacteria bacterium]
MEFLKPLFDASPLIAIFLCVALGYGIGRVRFGRFQIGGTVGTLFAAIVIGQVGVEVDPVLKTLAFALFIYSLGYVSGPQFFSSLGRSTLSHVHLSIFNSVLIFAVVWLIAQAGGLDKGTAAGLLAGATTESASVGTASEALDHMGLEIETAKALQGNIGVTYAVTYLFGFTLVVFFVSVLAPRMLGIDLKEAAKAYESELGDVGDDLEPGLEEGVKDVLVRVFKVTNHEAAGMTMAAFDERFDEAVRVHQLSRRGRELEVTPDRAFSCGDRAALVGLRDQIIEAGEFLGEETADVRGLSFVGETVEVVLTNRELVGATLDQVKSMIDPDLRRGVFLAKLTRVGLALDLRPRTRLEAGDVATLIGPPGSMEALTKAIGYAIDRSDHVDYVYLGVGIIIGVLIGMISVPIAGTPVALHTGGGCLISGLLLGWLRSKRPTFGSLPAATALHLKDFGLALFVAGVGLSVGPQALALLKEQGLMLPVLAIIVVLVPMISSMYFAKYVLKMNPVVICGALAGVFTCTAALNAIVAEADSQTPVLGYTVPYAIGNVLLTLLGPVIVLTA